MADDKEETLAASSAHEDEHERGGSGAEVSSSKATESGQSAHPHNHDSDKDRDAALLIQRNYRGYRTRRELDGCSLSADTRWQDAILRMRLQQAHKQANSGKNDSTTRWKRGGLLVGQLTGANDRSHDMRDANDDEEGSNDDKGGSMPGTKTDGPVEGGPSMPVAKPGEQIDANAKVGDVPGANDGDKIDNVRSIAKPNEHGLRAIERWTRGSPAQDLSKVMESQYWLEMVDSQHRYGSNLKYYHAKWLEAETDMNFFQWLDQGPGKELDLEECPRERLDSEKVMYLSAEQRKNYVVDIIDGKLYWRRNGKPVDTAKGKHRDLGDGRGIVDLGPDEQKEAEESIKRKALERGVSESSLDSVMTGSSSSDDEEMSSKDRRKEAAHYQSKRSGKKSRHLDALSPSNWSDMLLRKTIGANTWIYVYNHRGELYVGLKQTGYFQHSSFLYGGRVLSAGLLKVDKGQLTSLSPLSGHYRASSLHFRAFAATLQDGNVDLSRVTLSKSLLLLVGMEQYGAMMKKVKGGGGGGGGGSKDKEKDAKGGDGEHTKKKGGDAKHDDGKDGLVDRIKAKLHIGRGSAASDGHDEAAEAADDERDGESKREKLKDMLVPGHRKRREAAEQQQQQQQHLAPPTSTTQGASSASQSTPSAAPATTAASA